MNENNTNSGQNNEEVLDKILDGNSSEQKANSQTNESQNPLNGSIINETSSNKELQNINSDNILESILNSPSEPPKKEIFSININSFDDIIKIYLNNEYESVIITPEVDNVKVVFKKGDIEVDEKLITYPLYSNILIQIKSIVKIGSDFKKPQEGIGKYKFDNKDYNVNITTIPENLGEKITMTIIPKAGNNPSVGNLMTFIGAISIILFILGAAGITFVVINAKSVQDVTFFNSLGISLNNINSFIGTIVKIVFSLVLIIEIILFVFVGTKFLLTKKDLKKKRIVLGIISFLLLFLMFFSGTLWLAVSKKIGSLPNWEEMSYGEIQLYDNTKLLLPDLYSKSDSLIKTSDYGNLIGPVDIKFDLTYYQKNQEANGYKILKYTWNFGDGSQSEEITPTVIKTFKEKRSYILKVTVEKKQVDGKIINEDIPNIPSIGVKNLVKVIETKTNSGGKKVEFDATDIEEIGKPEWYMGDDFTSPVLVGSKFIPSKIIFKDTLVGLYIRKVGKTNTTLDKVFLIVGQDEGGISGEIKETMLDNDLTYEFSIFNIESGDGDGFIEKFKWSIDGYERTLTNEIGKEEDSSKIKYSFKSYGEKEIKVILVDSYGKTKEIKKTIILQKETKIKNTLSTYNGETKLNPRYENNIYYIQDLPIPTTVSFDARLVKTDNVFDSLQKVTWEVNGNGEEISGDIFNYKIEYEGKVKITVKYVFKNLKNSNLKELTDTIYIDSVKKDILLDLEINPSEEKYVPVVIKFDASKSQIKNENIVKFIYDYGDGTAPEERDAVNQGHKYTIPGTYTIKLTAITSSGNSYSITKNIVLKAKPQLAKIEASMKVAPISQGIDFSSANSEGQIVSYFWNFGDGETSTEANPTHYFDKAGTYEVKLKIEFSNHNILEDSMTIKIIN
ncbi:MAG: PKD domain-containing protein [Candidatus Gracilibacteria bacterium]|nr:PKD domain-containing protein [Candidatus Gracilibacteria bacterium]